ncbi:MAG: hypothetical protein IPP58_01650 [Holophagaceae bacterium]|uniref:POTRA domain-containing protein n=1 Tax=Candidatus Geothrix skivensis TaxID=2954439 RepID=A0A9D7SCU0_9BACT|nr:hypothetical protein [Candidatus Geothrix skivensis]
MRLRAVLGIGLLALAPAGAQEADGFRVLNAIRIEGGDEDDRRLAAAALGLKPAQSVSVAGFQQALTAVRLVDRFLSVEGRLGEDGSAELRLVPLRPLETWRWEGDAIPSSLVKTLLPELRKGQRQGPLSRAALERLAERRLREAGYPAATVGVISTEEGRSLRLVLSLGAPALIREIRIEGDLAPYSREKLLKEAGLDPGTTSWTPAVIREAQMRLRKLFVNDHRWWSLHDGRLEGTAQLTPGADPGLLLLEVHPGPKVSLGAKGLNPLKTLFGQPRLAEFVPLARAERYSPSLLEEGAGRITTYFRNQGYPEAKVRYERVVRAGTAERPEAVAITYFVEKGPRRSLGRIHFEGNRELSEEELRKEVLLPKRFLFLPPHAKTETVKALEDRVTAYYLQRGFPDVQVRRRVDTGADGSVEVRLIIREGQRRFLDALVLELPSDAGLPRGPLSKSLLLAFSDRVSPVAGTNLYRTDRRHFKGYEGTLEGTPRGPASASSPPCRWYGTTWPWWWRICASGCPPPERRSPR